MLYTTYELLLDRTRGEGNKEFVEPSHEDNPWLIPGKYYSFIYKCRQGDVLTPSGYFYNNYEGVDKYFFPDKNSASHYAKAFRITVLAISYNQLSHDAIIDKPYYGVGDSDNPDWEQDWEYNYQYVQLLQNDMVDNYRTDVDFSKWVIKYDINNDTNLYQWADNTYDSAGRPNGKGVIYYMKDEYGNEAYFDFKNIKIPYIQYSISETYDELYLKVEYYYLFSRMNDDYQVLELTYHNPIVNSKGQQIFTVARNKIKPVYKNIIVDGKTIKQLQLPRTHFEVRDLITDEGKSYIPLQDNIISNNCVGFKIVDCFLSKSAFNYYVINNSGDIIQQKVNLLKLIDDSISQLDLNTSAFSEAFNEKWEFQYHDPQNPSTSGCYLDCNITLSDINLGNIGLNQNKESYSNTLFCTNPYSQVRSKNVDEDDIPETIKQLGLINVEDLYVNK